MRQLVQVFLPFALLLLGETTINSGLDRLIAISNIELFDRTAVPVLADLYTYFPVLANLDAKSSTNPAILYLPEDLS